MLRAAAIALATFVAACQPSSENVFPTIKDPASLRVGLARTGCYGTCPVYGVEITGDGVATYCGLGFVRERGKRTRRIAPAEVERLVALFKAARFFELNDEYAASVTDNPTYEVLIAFDGLSKHITDYVGERAGMPSTVTEIEKAIDEATGTAEWIGQGGTDSNDDWPDCAVRFSFEPPEIVLPEFR